LALAQSIAQTQCPDRGREVQVASAIAVDRHYRRRCRRYNFRLLFV